MKCISLNGLAVISGNSPVCVLRCPCSSHGLEKDLPQTTHLQGSVCVRMCIFRAPIELYDLSHCLHVELSLVVEVVGGGMFVVVGGGMFVVGKILVVVGVVWKRLVFVVVVGMLWTMLVMMVGTFVVVDVVGGNFVELEGV